MVTSRSFRLHATHTTKTVAFTGYISLRSASAAVRGAMPQMVPAVTRSANSSLAEAYSGFCIVGRTPNGDTEFGLREMNVNKTCCEAGVDSALHCRLKSVWIQWRVMARNGRAASA
jgi:hypothetical protein